MIHFAKVELKIPYVNMSEIISFIKKASLNDVTPKFAVIKGQFISEVDSLTASHHVS